MAITYVGGQVGGRAGSTSTSSITFALTGGTNSTPQAGDLVIIGCTVASQGRTPTCAISGYTAQTQINANGTTYDTSLNMSRKFMGGTPDTTFTLPSTGNVQDAQRYTVQVWRGVDTTTPLDVTPVSASGTATGRPNPGSITPTTTGAFVGIIGAGAAATGAAYTAPANYTTNFLTGTTADTNDAMVGSGYRSWTSGAEDPAAYTGGTTNAVDSWAAFTYALRPAPNNYPLTALGGAYTLSGASAVLKRSKLLTASGGSYALTGASAVLTKGVANPIIQSVYNVEDSGGLSTTIAATITGVIAGNALVVFVGYGGVGLTVTVSDGTTYTESASGVCEDTGNNQASRVFYLANAGSGSHTITATLSSSAGYRRIRVFEISGLASSGIEDVSADQFQDTPGTTTDVISSSATATTTQADCLVLGLSQDTLEADPGSGTLTAGTGYTIVGSNLILGAEYKVVSTTGAQTATFTQSVDNSHTTHVIAFKKATASSNYTLTAQGGSYSLAGGSASLLRSKKIVSTGGSYALTGASAILKRSKYILANGGSYTLTGASAILLKNLNWKLTAQGGAYSLTGASAGLLRSKRIIASGGAYTLTGAAATLLRSKYIQASGGSYTVNGANAILLRSKVIVASGGTYTYTGQNAVITKSTVTGYTLTALGGSYSLTGTSAILLRNRNLSASGGTYGLTGASANLVKGRILTATGGSYTLSGAQGVISRNRKLTSTGGAYTLTGGSATIKRDRILTSTGGTYTLVGASANLIKGRVISAQGGAYSYQGSSANIRRDRNLSPTGGVYSLTGGSALISRGRSLTASGGAYALTGASAIVSRNRKLSATGGVYTYTGAQITFTYVPLSTNYTLTALGGSYALTGSSATILRSKQLIVQGGTYSLVGQTAILSRNRSLSAQGGSYTQVGANALLLRNKLITALGGSYTLTGGAASLNRNRVLQASGGAYIYTGSSINISFFGGAVWPSPSQVLKGVVYGPTGADYIGTLDYFGLKFDITTKGFVKPLTDKFVMLLKRDVI